MSNVRNLEPRTIIRDLFATPVGVFDWPDTDQLNAELKTAIMERYNSSPGLVSSNRKGWHSKFDMHQWPEACVAELMAMVKESAARLTSHFAAGMDERLLRNWQIKSCWSNVNPVGGYNQPHHHIAGNTLLSGFYYVDIGDCPDPSYAGRTIFQDRSGVARPVSVDGDLFSREYAVIPRAGTMALFPAALFHYVEPYQGNGMRISVAFNLSHPNLEALYYPEMLEQSWWWKNFRGLMLLKTKFPEKVRAFRRFASYFVEELRHPRQDASFLKRVRVTLDRAEADEAEIAEASRQAGVRNGGLSEKRPFV